jgi:hypothetical protein
MEPCGLGRASLRAVDNAGERGIASDLRRGGVNRTVYEPGDALVRLPDLE